VKVASTAVPPGYSTKLNWAGSASICVGLVVVKNSSSTVAPAACITT
jgi:hypothetical protein